jgi:hypothetical protein
MLVHVSNELLVGIASACFFLEVGFHSTVKSTAVTMCADCCEMENSEVSVMNDCANLS